MRIGVLLSGWSTQYFHVRRCTGRRLRERADVEGRNLADLSAMQLDTMVTSCTATTRSAASAADFTVNMRTAQAIGIAIPRELRLQAHSVIE